MILSRMNTIVNQKHRQSILEDFTKHKPMFDNFRWMASVKRRKKKIHGVFSSVNLNSFTELSDFIKEEPSMLYNTVTGRGYVRNYVDRKMTVDSKVTSYNSNHLICGIERFEMMYEDDDAPVQYRMGNWREYE